ncbi:MAG: leucine-rich repeat protein [Clostridia bacterium]|nr:leucine-rich repeat protein [Clostridia bacterium]
MKKRICSLLTVICIVLNLVVCLSVPVFAETYGDLTYEIKNNQVIIINCKSIATKVDIPDYIDGFPVTTIGERAFENCDRITSLIIGNNVTTISWRAFFNCNELTELTIGNNVATIGKYAFRYCENLTSIKVNGNNQFFCDINGVLFDKNKTKIIKYPEGRTDSTYVIPNSVTTIGERAFEFNYFITDVTIGNSVTIIEEEAFLCCNNLARAIIPDGVKTIGKDSFRSCDSLKSVEIGDSITTIDVRAFEECENLASVTLGNGITFIGESAFRLCDYLENVYYEGTKEKWDAIIIEGRNTGLSNATIHFNKETSNNKSNWRSSFSDVSEDHWAYDAIMELADLGVINGMGDGTYNPEGTVTREQFIKLLVCADDKDNDFYPEVDFPDVEDNSWSYEYICTGLSNGIFDLNELQGDKFEPQKGIDRDTVALWAVNTLGVWLDEESNFNDNYKINNSEAVATAVDEGIIKGYEDNTFRPNNTLTRAEAAAIIKRTIDKIADNKKLRFSPNKVTYSDDVEYRIEHYELEELDVDNKYCKIEDPGLTVANLQEGDILVIEPHEDFPSGFAMEIKRKQLTGGILEFWGEDVKTEEVFDKIDISTMISGDLGYIAENSVPKGIEVTNAKGQTIAMAKEALKADDNYFYASTGGFQQTLKGTEELDLLKFKLEYEKDSFTKISGEITVLNPQFVVDFKFNKLSGLEYAELKAVLSCDAEVKYEKKLESREEDLTRIPLAKLVMPVGTTGLYLEGNLYCDVGIDGKVEVNFETSQSFETGVKYEHGKLKNIKEQKNKSSLSATAEGTIKFGPNTELTLSACGVINLKFGFEAGLKLDMALAKDIKEENGVKTYHECDLCIDGDLSGYFEVGGDITVGKGIFKVTVIEAKNEWEYIIADFYISRQLKEDKGTFGWGECENYAYYDMSDQRDILLGEWEGILEHYTSDYRVSAVKPNSSTMVISKDSSDKYIATITSEWDDGITIVTYDVLHSFTNSGNLYSFVNGQVVKNTVFDTLLLENWGRYLDDDTLGTGGFEFVKKSNGTTRKY